MEGIRAGLPAGSLSLSPTFVLWAAIFCALLLIAGAVLWLVRHEALQRLLRRLWLGDVVAGWLLYAALYHLVFLERFRLVLGRPLALWLLLAALGGYGLLRRLPTPLRRPGVAFAAAVLVWSGVIVAGQRYVQETWADAALLATQPQAVLSLDAPRLRPLRRVVLLSRVEPELRDATLRVLAMLERAVPPDTATLSAYRLSRLPELVDNYQHDLAKLRTYQWLQGGLLAVMLLLWGFGRVPAWQEP
jgi:hypothetical protein